MNNTLFDSIRGTTSFGELGLDGALGYNGFDVFLPTGYDSWESISAHGPSSVTIKTKLPLRILGTLNGSSARLFHEHPVRFFVNGWALGECYGPWDVTKSIVIPPGEQILNVEIEWKCDHCHSVWLCKVEPLTEIATPENTVFLSVDTFGTKNNYSARMRRTAEKQGINVIFLDEGLPWRGFYHRKTYSHD